jgi:hypothetical protein
MNLSELSYRRKEEISKFLIDNGYDPKAIAVSSKPTLIELARKIILKREIENAPIESEEAAVPIFVAIENTPVVENSVAPVEVVTSPDRCSPEWSDYVMSFFADNEKIDNYPTCDGLRRVFELLIGPISEVDMQVIQSAELTNKNRATVKCTITYTDKTRDGWICKVSEVADTSDLNTEFPYSLYPTATAATVAEGRALRKTLRLRTLAKEEIMRPDDKIVAIQQEADKAASPITDSQRIIIPKMCTQLGISVEKLLRGLNKPTVVDSLNYSDAQDVVLKLHSYSKTVSEGGEAIPEDLFNV